MKKLFVLPFVLMVVFSCKNDPPDAPCITDAASISGSYKITGYTYKQSATSPEIDYYSTLFPDACERDDVLGFSANGTYQKTDAGIVCSPPENDNGIWSLASNTMTIDGDPATIESFDCKTLVLTSPDFMITGDKLKIILTKQ